MKNTNPVTLISAMSVSCILFIISCTSDVVDPCGVTYDAQVRNIVIQTCAYTGCHSGPTASPYVPASAKDYTTYGGMMETVQSGKFRERAIDLQTMPPQAFVPAGKPKSLTTEERDELMCWLDSGHPEK
jgi:uncharacterized membrane protein